MSMRLVDGDTTSGNLSGSVFTCELVRQMGELVHQMGELFRQIGELIRQIGELVHQMAETPVKLVN
jgi:methyl-accepting chemotaxis protein